MENENQSSKKFDSEAPTENSVSPQPQVTNSPVTTTGGSVYEGNKSARFHKKLVYLIALLLVIGIAVLVYLLSVNKTDSNNLASSTKPSVLNSAKKQYYLNDSVAGYISYKPAVFKEVEATKLPTIPLADPDVNVIIVQANLVGFSDSGLYLYDLKANKTYRLTDGGGSPRLMSDHYLLYGFDIGSGVNKRLGGKLLNLQTGQTQTVFSDTPENVAGTICCSVSPDGFKAAFVQKNKISVWDIRTQKTIDYTATVNPIDPNFSRTSANDYNTENSYATPQWLDNDTLIYTDKPADSPVDNQPAKIVDDTLYKLSLSDDKSTELKTNASGIYDIYVAAGSTFVDEVLVSSPGSSQISLILLDGTEGRTIGFNPGFVLISPSGLGVYTFSTQDSGGYTVLKTDANDPNTAPTAFNPHINGVKVSQILPRGWIDNDRMLLAELDTAGTQNHEYIAVYNTTTDKVDQYLQIN